MTEITEINLQIMHLLKNGDSMTPKQIINLLPNFIVKDVKYSIRRLREKGLIRVIPNLLDMRRVFYRLSTPNEIKNITKITIEELQTFQELAVNAHGSNTTIEEMKAAAQM